MAFVHVKGPAKTEGWRKTASVAIAANSILGLDGTDGYVRQANAATTRIVGISLRKITSSSTDYASNSVIPVIIPSSDDVFEADTTGTATQANVGERYDIGTNTDGTAQNVNLSGTTQGVITVVEFISSSKVLVKLNGNYAYTDDKTIND